MICEPKHIFSPFLTRWLFAILKYLFIVLSLGQSFREGDRLTQVTYDGVHGGGVAVIEIRASAKSRRAHGLPAEYRPLFSPVAFMFGVWALKSGLVTMRYWEVQSAALLGGRVGGE